MRPKKKNAKMPVKKGKKQHARASLKQKQSAKKKIEKKSESDAKPKGNKTLLIAQEVKFARLLANNDKKVRDKVLKNLKKWLMMRSQSSFAFTEEDFMRLWKGLFYCMWMSDKPLVQEELADSLSKIVHCFNSTDTALLYTKCTLKSLTTEWFGIDRYRVDKFEMLVRKIIRQTFELCKRQSWSEECVVGMGKVIEEILFDPKSCLGLNLHITEVYMEELAKVSQGQIPVNIVTEFIRPFVIHLANISDQRQLKHVIKHIFRYLIFQSDVGMDYAEKFNAWRQAGFPCQNIDDMQKVEVSDEESEDEKQEEDDKSESSEAGTEDKPLDPRAGRIDVEIPQIPFDPVEIASVLKTNKFHKSSTTLTRKHISRLINDFTKLTKGDMPFGIKEIPVAETRINSYEAAEELLNFNEDLYSDSNKNNRKRKKNGNITEFETDNTEELIPQNQNSCSIKNSSIKKQKLVGIDDNQELTDKSSKSTKQNSKNKRKKKSDKLKLSEPISSKKLKKSSKKLSNTFSECKEESTVSANLGTNKGSTSCNWEVDVAGASTSQVTTPLNINGKIKSPKKRKTKADEGSETESDISWLTPVLTRLEEQGNTPKTPKSALKQTPKTDSVKKRVKIMLQKNTAQNTCEYFRQLRQSPAIPFDANRKPKAGVLKPSPIPSPVNPFYKRKIF